MSMKAVPGVTVGLLALAGVLGLIAVACGPHTRTSAMSELAQLVQQGQISTIEVGGDGAVATPRQQEKLGLHVEQSAAITLESKAGHSHE
jgi:hypothetical protein